MKTMINHLKSRWLVTILILLLLDVEAVVWGFAEEEIGFRDKDGTYYPPTGNFPDNRVSTLHDDLTYALALAAGFTVTDSQTIRIWDQLVDSEVLPSATVSYTYGNAGFNPEPNPNVVCLGKNHNRQIWPMNSFDPATSSVTARLGPYSPFFHYPHRNGADLQALHDWGWGITSTLVGYEAYAWGKLSDPTLIQAIQSDGCAITRTAVINMPATVPAGSLKAFGTYLHSLADAYSHEDCLTALGTLSPWGTHTVTAYGDPSIYACDYNPSQPLNNDAHGREFGQTYTDTQRTINAARAVYAELSAWSIQRDGWAYPLALTTTMIVSGTTTTLDGAIIFFVTQWNYDRPSDRRAYADKLVQAIPAQPRAAIQRVRLPLILK